MDLCDPEPVDHHLFRMIFLTNDPDHFINIQIRDQIAIEEVKTFLDLIEAELSAANNNFAAMIEISAQDLAQAHHLRRAFVQHVHVEAKARFKITDPEQAFHQDVGLDGFSAGFENEADVLSTLITYIREKRCLFALNQVG